MTEKDHLKILFYLVNRTSFLCHTEGQKERFSCIFTQMCCFYSCVYTNAYKAIKRNNVQRSKCESGHWKLVSFLGSHNEWLNSQHKTVLLPPALMGSSYITSFFLISTSLISFLLHILSFFESQTSFIVFSYTLIYKCPSQLSPCTIPLPVVLWSSAHRPASLGDAQRMFSSPGASLNSRAKSLILNVSVWAAYNMKSSQIFF